MATSKASWVEEQAANWLARQDAGSWGAPQQAELQAWLDAATAHRVAYLRLASVWQRADRLTLLRDPHRTSVAAQAWWGGRALARFSTRRLAAGVLLAAALGAGLAASGLLRPGTGYTTALGETKSVALADGSRVALNTDTRLRARMAERERTVWLDSGEAYFEVTHDVHRPFVVEAGASRVTVLGTKFSVRRDGERLKVVVAEGRVQVVAGSAGTTGLPVATVITRNDALEVVHGQASVAHRSAEQVADQLGWRQGRLVLDDMTLAQAAAEFNRYNNVKLVVADPVAADLRIGGRFNVDNVQGFARLLQQGFGLKVEVEKEEIRVHR